MAPPAPKLWLDLPYAIALRDLFEGYKFRAQQNTRYMEADMAEATITHVLDTLISRMTSADIQSTITPDEGRNVPWHYNNILGVNTARQTLMGIDGLMEMVELKKEGYLPGQVRELKERAALFLEEIIQNGGYFAAVQQGQFVDSGYFPERSNDGIARDPNGGVSAGTIIKRQPDYGAPVCSHFGANRLTADAPSVIRPKSFTSMNSMTQTTSTTGSKNRWRKKRTDGCDRKSNGPGTALSA
jgi:D-ornithine 4,5-aminomutase subunit beta